jgi:hypothetical protein
VKEFCDITTRNGNYACTRDARWVVGYFQDGADSKPACGKHVSKALEEVLSGHNVPKDAVLWAQPLRRKS